MVESGNAQPLIAKENLRSERSEPPTEPKVRSVRPSEPSTSRSVPPRPITPMQISFGLDEPQPPPPGPALLPPPHPLPEVRESLTFESASPTVELDPDNKQAIWDGRTKSKSSMFKFDFEIEEADDTEELLHLEAASNNTRDQPSAEVSSIELEPSSEISLEHLLDAIPALISYSPLSVPLSSPRKATTLIRRDLFDARFQLISEGAGDAVDDAGQEGSGAASDLAESVTGRQALAFLDAPSDLVPGVYEGGLKTWECSLDLVDYLDGLKDTPALKTFIGKRILEVGCGTGVPSLYILRELLSQMPPTEIEIPGKPHPKTEIHLQDYNVSVLQLVTLPNILLTWCTSPHADAYRSATSDEEVAPVIDPTNAGELPITPELKDAFLNSLSALNISLRLFSGSWNTFDPIETTGPASYDILLTSETIYRSDSLDPLVNLMQKVCTGKRGSSLELENLVSSRLTLDEFSEEDKPHYLCLVAAKVLYFGVGGGVSDFLKRVTDKMGRVETVSERTAGVRRKIMRVYWP